MDTEWISLRERLLEIEITQTGLTALPCYPDKADIQHTLISQEFILWVSWISCLSASY